MLFSKAQPEESPYMRPAVAFLLLLPHLPGQQLVKDPYFTDARVWTPINDLTPPKILAWGPLRIDMTTQGPREWLGVQQAIRVEVETSGWYQLCMSGSSIQWDDGGMPISASVLSGTTALIWTQINCRMPIPDTDMHIGFLGQGDYTLRISCSQVWGLTPRLFQSISNACFLRRVELPCPSWTIQGGYAERNLRTYWISGAPPYGTDLVLPMLSAHRLDVGLPLPGILGLLQLDPWRSGGIIFLPLKGVDSWILFDSVPIQWTPLALHAQLLAIDIDLMRFTLGSRTYSLPQ